MRALRVVTSTMTSGVMLATICVAAQRPADVSWSSVAPGVEHAQIVRGAPSGGSWQINALRVDMARARLDVVRARDRATGLEPVTSIAARTGALAAINGGYFRTSGDYLGDSTGTLQIDGVLWSEPDRGRASVGLERRGTASRLIFGHVGWRARIDVGGRQRSIDGINRARGADDLVLFTPQFGAAPLTDPTGIEVVVLNGRVSAIHIPGGGTAIPAAGLVISARGEAAAWLRRVAMPGARVRVRTSLVPIDGAINPWPAAEDILGAGPKLVTGGRVDITDQREKMIPTFRTDLHPRTAIASLHDGRALLVVADGRHPPERVGLALDDLARLLIELGAREAINLDGGGSTTMVVKGAIVNSPSDLTGERPVSDAIIVRAP